MLGPAPILLSSAQVVLPRVLSQQKQETEDACPLFPSVKSDADERERERWSDSRSLSSTFFCITLGPAPVPRFPSRRRVGDLSTNCRAGLPLCGSLLGLVAQLRRGSGPCRSWWCSPLLCALDVWGFFFCPGVECVPTHAVGSASSRVVLSSFGRVFEPKPFQTLHLTFNRKRVTCISPALQKMTRTE